jgi:hypothetical protein
LGKKVKKILKHFHQYLKAILINNLLE